MMKIHTSRFGEMEISEDTLITFPSGIVGFPSVQRYVVFETPGDSDYQWFQAVEEPSLAFVIIDVHLLKPDFQVELSDEGLTELGITESDPVLILAVVTIPPGNPVQASANLRAPLVVNLRTRRGKQVILHESIPLHFPLIPAQSGVENVSVLSQPASV